MPLKREPHLLQLSLYVEKSATWLFPPTSFPQVTSHLYLLHTVQSKLVWGWTNMLHTVQLHHGSEAGPICYILYSSSMGLRLDQYAILYSSSMGLRLDQYATYCTAPAWAWGRTNMLHAVQLQHGSEAGPICYILYSSSMGLRLDQYATYCTAPHVYPAYHPLMAISDPAALILLRHVHCALLFIRSLMVVFSLETFNACNVFMQTFKEHDSLFVHNS
jgi:hypothetical protein